MRKILQASVALVVIVATGAFGGPRGEAKSPGAPSSGRGIGAVMNDALNGIEGAIGCCNGPQTVDGTKLGAVRDNAPIGSGGWGDPGGNDNGGIGGGVRGNDPNDVSGNSVGY